MEINSLFNPVFLNFLENSKLIGGMYKRNKDKQCIFYLYILIKINSIYLYLRKYMKNKRKRLTFN